MRVNRSLYLAVLTAAFTSVIHAQNSFSFNGVPSVTAGAPFQITWTPSTGTQNTITLLLKQGDAAQLANVMTIATHIQNVGSYAWAVPATLVKGSNYCFEIVDDGNQANVNYSIQFAIDSKILAGSPAASAGRTPSESAGSVRVTTAAVLSGAGNLGMISRFGRKLVFRLIVVMAAVAVVSV